jgi:hypothetical protein
MRSRLHLPRCIVILVLTGCAEASNIPTDAIAPSTLSFITTSTATQVQVSTVAQLRAAVTNAVPNTAINVAAGTYNLGNQGIKIDEKSALDIFGAGIGTTVIKTGPGAAYAFELAGRVSNLSVAHLSIEGTYPATTNTHALASGFNRISLSGARFFDLDIRNVAVGISVESSSVGGCTDVQITKNYLTNIQEFFKPDGTTPGSGYGIHNDGCTATRIANNVIRDADRHSIYQARGYQQPGPGSVVIEHNLIIDHAKTSALNETWLVALVVARSSNVVVANNVLVNPYHDALSIETAGPYVVNNVRLINNTVLGGRDMDLLFEAGGTYTMAGNRFFHRDATGFTTSPTIRRWGVGASGRLVEPAPYVGTKALASSAPFTTMFGMVGTVLGKATPVYNTDPATWPMTANTAVRWTQFEDLAANRGLAYVVNGRRLIEVNGATWAQRAASWTFLAPTMLGSDAAGGLIALTANRVARIDLTSLERTIATAPGSGPNNGLAVFGGSAYLMRANCFYEVSIANLTSASMGC